MSKARHRSGKTKTSWGILLGIASAIAVVTGVCLGASSVAELLRYSPYGNPEAGTVGWRLAIASAILIGVPVLWFLAALVVKSAREYRSWMRTLTPAQQSAVRTAQLIAMETAHVVLRDHNREVDRRLSASVMGAKNPEDQA